MTEEEMYTMLQRLKKENKELRKSRNSLQSDHSLLSKIEGKLRYKMEILLKKLSHVQSDLPVAMQKKLSSSGSNGSIEETIDALMEHITWISDRYIAVENELKATRENQAKAAGESVVREFCQDLKQFALQHELIRKNTLQDDSWMSGHQKNSNEIEAHPWKTLFKHMSSALDAEKQTRKDTMEWLKSHAAHYGDKIDDKNEDLMDCVMRVMKSVQSEQTQLKLADESVKKEKQELAEELKDLRNTLSKEMESKEQTLAQAAQMESAMSVLRRENTETTNNLKQAKEQLEMSASKMTIFKKEAEEKIEQLRAENQQIRKEMQETQTMNEGFKSQMTVMGQEKEKALELVQQTSTERDEFKEQLMMLRQEKEELQKEKAELKKELEEITGKEVITTSIAVQTDPIDMSALVNEELANQMKCLMDENAELLSEINRLIQTKSKFNNCDEPHKGEVMCMVSSPQDYLVCTGGIDYTVRLWRPRTTNTGDAAPIFEPYASALVEGKILSLAMTRDGKRIACGCSVRDTPNGYVVVWDIGSQEVLCNLRSRPTQRFGKVSAIAFGNESWIFAGDITGQIYVYDVNTQQQLAHIHGHKDVIHQLRILTNNVMISVCHDQWLGQFDLTMLTSSIGTSGASSTASSKTNSLAKKRRTSDSKQLAASLAQARLSGKNLGISSSTTDLKHFQIEYLFKDEKYPLLTSDFFDARHVITGSRKLMLVPLHSKHKSTESDEKEKPKSKEKEKEKENEAESFGTDKDLDRIHQVSTYRNKYVMVHRTNLDYIKVFNTTDGSMVCKCDVKQSNIAAIGYSYDGKYAIVCLSTNSPTVGSVVAFVIA